MGYQYSTSTFEPWTPPPSTLGKRHGTPTISGDPASAPTGCRAYLPQRATLRTHPRCGEQAAPVRFPTPTLCASRHPCVLAAWAQMHSGRRGMPGQLRAIAAGAVGRRHHRRRRDSLFLGGVWREAAWSHALLWVWTVLGSRDKVLIHYVSGTLVEFNAQCTRIRVRAGVTSVGYSLT